MHTQVFLYLRSFSLFQLCDLQSSDFKPHIPKLSSPGPTESSIYQPVPQSLFPFNFSRILCIVGPCPALLLGCCWALGKCWDTTQGGRMQSKMGEAKGGVPQLRDIQSPLGCLTEESERRIGVCGPLTRLGPWGPTG